MQLSDPISILKGVGSIREKTFQTLGVETVKDLLYYFPRRHLDRTALTKINQLKIDSHATIIVCIESFREKRIRKGRIFQVVVSDDSGLLSLNWFNGIRFVKNLFQLGDKLVLHGKIGWYNGFSMTHPEFEKIEEEEDPITTGMVMPIYPLSQKLRLSGIEQKSLRRILRGVLRNINHIADFLPNQILRKNKLISLDEALRYIHFSESLNQLNSAIERLKFDEHFFFQLIIALRKKSFQNSKTKRFIDIGPYFRKVSNIIDFNLTNAQKRVIQEIHLDMKRNFPMNRLIQGDVGSGKTIVAILTSAIAVGNNVQVSIMAPTEILATQHYQSFKSYFDNAKITCALLTGKMKLSERKLILNGLEKGNIDVIIGTHAIIQPDITFKNLGLIIIDEQHRFGVKQRASLQAKGENPHTLSMTATPIPRTLSITYNGDMDLSLIDELPKNRIPVTTKVIEPSRINKVYQFIRKEVSQKKQCIIVYPLVEESKSSDLAAAEEAYKELSSIQFHNFEVGLLHGKMGSDDKKKIINQFENNDISILVSTTVIEVGIDIKNATVMVVEHSERFGLTQLHQLRGRVGRGESKSYCILVKRDLSDASQERLSIMENTNDGFVIADEDLKLRGPGEFFGSRQSGFFRYKIADMVKDGKLIRKARAEAFKLVEKDFRITDNQNQFIKEYLISEYSKYLVNINLS